MVEVSNQNMQKLQLHHCNILQQKLRDGFILSTKSQLLAAQMFQYQECSALEMHGKTGILRQCKKVRVNITSDITNCGPQPIAQVNGKNYTIGKDGLSLIPYTPCFWTNGFINIDGTSFEWHDRDWIPVHTTLFPTHLLPIPLLNYTLDDTRTFVTRYQKPEAFAMNLLAELSGLAQERGGNVLSDVIEDVQDKNNLSLSISWIESVKTTLSVIGGLSNWLHYQ